MSSTPPAAANSSAVLHEFISANIGELALRARVRVHQRLRFTLEAQPLDDGLELLLAQLAALLKGPLNASGGGTQIVLDDSASASGQRLHTEGLTIGQVVHGYGDICQVVTELAVELGVGISAADFRAFNASLDKLIAHAVTEFSRAHEKGIATGDRERMSELAQELRSVISTAIVSFQAIQIGVVGTQGSVGAMHTRSLDRLRGLVNKTFEQIRVDTGLTPRKLVLVRELIEEAAAAAQAHADGRGLELFVGAVEDRLVVNIDKQALAKALATVLKNALEVTRPPGLVSLNTHSTGTHVMIDVQDECGGLGVLTPGLGLQSARRAVESHGGILHVVDLPTLGCRFTIELPKA